MTSTSEPIRMVTADSGARYTLGQELGRGAQGAVFSTADGKWAVKLLFDKSAARRERLRQRLSFVRRLDLQSLPIAGPEETLRAPQLGYLMRRLTGMAPLHRLIVLPPGVSVIPWYRGSGGLRRRLQLCLRLSEALAVLHGRGLCYGDPSPNNVFVSDAADASELRLIDTDNLHYEATPGIEAVFTPGYGAPELQRSEGLMTTLSDAHALAVLCFQLLRLSHPLFGDQVLEGDPELEEAALRGELPYIDDLKDPSNSARTGLPADLVLSPRLQQIFCMYFQAGLRDPSSRPGAASLAADLRLAAGATVLCPVCGWSYYFTVTRCPDCETPRPALWHCEVLLWDPSVPPDSSGARLCLGPDGKPRRLGLAIVCAGAPVVLSGVDLGDGSAGIRLSLRGRDLVLEPLDGQPRALRAPHTSDGGDVFEREERRLTAQQSLLCHLTLSRNSAPWRVLRCKYSAEVPRAPE